MSVLEKLTKICNFRPETVASAMIKMIQEGKSGAVWVTENNKETYEYFYPSREEHSYR